MKSQKRGKLTIIKQIFKAKLKGELWLIELVGKKRVLDIGCGRGELLSQLGGNTFGIDINEEALAVAQKRNLKIIQANASHLSFRNETFFAIVNTNVIEHLHTEEAYAMLSESSRILQPGGLLFIKTEVVTEKFWNTFSHTRPYPPGALIKITNVTSQETFPKLKQLRPLLTLYEGEYHTNPILFNLNNILAQFIPTFRRSYIMILEKQ